MKKYLRTVFLSLFKATLLFFAFFVLADFANAARLYITPATAAVPVGETFTLKVGIDTEGEEINALDLKITFPADKLQLVSPNTSLSLIDVWASQPKFNNRTGEVALQGGVPNGVTASSALITDLTFRVRSTGQALVQFSSDSRVFLNDGKATPAGLDYQNALLSLQLPPPGGPVISSGTHGEERWTRAGDVVFEWLAGEGEAYSFVLDKNPVTIPDTIVDGDEGAAYYSGVPEGVSFFHVRALREGVWGGTSHYEVKVDTTPPASFAIDIFPSSRTSVKQPTFRFQTSDAHSGISHYEFNIIPLFNTTEGAQTGFIEVTSPYIAQELEPGPYEVIVRAHDMAGNVTEENHRFRIVTGALTLTVGEGLVIRDIITIPWIALLLVLAFLAGLIAREISFARRFKMLYARKAKHHKTTKAKADPDTLKNDMQELKKYRKKYGHLAAILLVLASMLTFGQSVFAADESISTPIITSWSEYVTNNEIFYIKGDAGLRVQSVLLYLQNLADGSLVSYDVEIEEDGQWLYRHDQFLSPGEYALWVQGVAGDVVSPPGAQYKLIVEREALSFGSSRLTLAAFYLIIILFLAIALVAVWIITRRRRFAAHRQYLSYLKEANEAEEAVRQGFGLLYKQLAKHLAELRSKIESGTIDARDIAIEEAEILADMEQVEARINKEVLDIETILRKHDDSDDNQ